MRNLFLVGFLFVFLSPKLIFAADAYSSSSVTVNGNHTSIRVESNGQVKTYESDSTGSVTVQTDDGSAKAFANAGLDSTSDPNPTIIPTIHRLKTLPTLTPTISVPKITGYPTPTVSPIITMSSPPDLLTKLLLFFRNLFKLH